jgi:twitching motility protein PilT
VPKIDGLFDELIKRGGSDLHLGAGAPPLARIRGELVALREAPVAAKDLEDVLLEVLSAPQRTRLQTELELDFSHAHKGGARFRASYFRTSSGLGAAFRLVPGRVPSLADLACPEILRRLAERRGGLVLVTGPGRSGRSTTLAAMVDHVNKTRACHVLALEDPTEFVHEPLRAQITHREIGVHAPSFEAALRSAGRDDADVVLVSAVRSAETAKLALRLASQGVLVLAALDTNGAVATLDRLVHRFPADEQPQARGLLAEGLAGVVSQQLLSTADGAGRVAVHEILVGSAAVSVVIREGKTAQLLNVMQAGQAQGMQTLDMGLERLLTEGRVSAEEALDRAVDREAFARVIARVRPDLAELLG